MREPVLVVEDEPLTRKLTHAVLAGAGYDVRTAADGEEAVALLAAWLPGLILLDLRLPRMTAGEFLAQVRSGAATMSIPVWAFTASNPDEIAEAELAGCAAHIAKPFAPDDLLARVGGLLRPGSAPAPVAGRPRIPGETGPALEAGTAERWRGLAAGQGPRFLSHLLQMLRDSVREEMSALRAATAAGDGRAAASAAHRLRGACLFTGAPRAVNLCLLLEAAARDGRLAEARASLPILETEIAAAEREIAALFAELGSESDGR